MPPSRTDVRGVEPEPTRPAVPRWQTWAATAAGLAIVAGLAWWVTNSSVFRVRSLVIRGAHHLSREDVARAGGLRSSTNVLWFSSRATEERLEANPWISEASVSRTLPSTISVRIRERRAIAVVLAEAGRFLVAADGTVLETARSRSRLPSFTAPAGWEAALVPGEAVPSAMPAFAVIRSLSRPLRSAVERVDVDPADGIVLTLRGGGRALYGNSSQVDAKATALGAVLSWARRADVSVSYIDVRAPEAPALRPTRRAA